MAHGFFLLTAKAGKGPDEAGPNQPHLMKLHPTIHLAAIAAALIEQMWKVPR